MGLLWGLALLAACAAPQGPESCLTSSEDCPPGTFCDSLTQRCVSDKLLESERCRLPIDCPDAARPLCRDGLCTPCTNISDMAASDAACVALGQPLLTTCVRSGPRKGQCGECRQSGQCSDPGRPVCGDGLCRACEVHSDCAESGLCNDGSGLVDIPGVGVGQCAPAERVIFVHAEACPTPGSSATGSREKPFCELAAASGKGSYIVVAPRMAGTYAPAVFGDGKRTVIVGPGREGTAHLSSVTATGTRTAVVVVDAALTSSGAALSCGAGAGLSVARVAVHQSGIGVDASGCDRVEISQTLIERGKGPAVRIAAGTRSYRIVNSQIFANVGPTAVQIGMGSTGVFAQNTVINNGAMGSDGGAVSCEGVATLTDSLFVQNGRSMRTDGMGNPLGTQFVGGCKLNNVVVGIDAAAAGHMGFGAIPDLDNKLRLLSTPNNEACCVDKALRCEGDFDYFGSPRKLGEGCELGAHELR